MQITNIRIDEIFENRGSPVEASGTAVFDDGYTCQFSARFAYSPDNFDVQITDKHHEYDKREQQNAALELIRTRLGFDDIRAREQDVVASLVRNRVAACEKLIRTAAQ